MAGAICSAKCASTGSLSGLRLRDSSPIQSLNFRRPTTSTCPHNLTYRQIAAIRSRLIHNSLNSGWAATPAHAGFRLNSVLLEPEDDVRDIPKAPLHAGDLDRRRQWSSTRNAIVDTPRGGPTPRGVTEMKKPAQSLRIYDQLTSWQLTSTAGHFFVVEHGHRVAEPECSGAIAVSDFSRC